MLDALERIKNLLDERHWTAYRLAKESGLPQSTISNLFNRCNEPTIPTLEMICKGLGITLSQFFADGDLVQLTPEQQKLFNEWVTLSPEDKLLVEQLVKKLKTAK